MEEKNKKTSKVDLWIIIILIIIIICLIGFIISDKFINNDASKETINNEPEIVDDNNNSTNNTDLEFDITKEAINGRPGWAYKPVNDNNASTIGLFINLSESKKTATITIDWSKYFGIYGISLTTGETREYAITNFTKKIKDVYIAGFGQSSGHETAFYVMEDGTVEYTPINNALGEKASSSETILKSYGKINDVSGVVKIISATDYCPNDNTCIGGSYNILGIKQDGTFYNLSEILLTTNYYEQ